MAPTYWLITKQNLLLVQPNDNNVPATRNMIIATFCTWCPSKKKKGSMLRLWLQKNLDINLNFLIHTKNDVHLPMR